MLLYLMKKELMTNRVKTLVDMKYYGAGWVTQHNTTPEKMPPVWGEISHKNSQQTNLGAKTNN